MNWITKFIKPRLKTLLKKRQPRPDDTSLWTTCVCQQLIYKEELYKNFLMYEFNEGAFRMESLLEYHKLFQKSHPVFPVLRNE